MGDNDDLRWVDFADLAMLGITSHSKVPLRIATMLGFVLSGLSMVTALAYLVAAGSLALSVAAYAAGALVERAAQVAPGATS